MSEFMDRLKDDFQEEIACTHKYFDMAHEAEDYGMHNEAKLLRDMAKDEHSHAKHILSILDEHGKSEQYMHDDIYI